MFGVLALSTFLPFVLALARETFFVRIAELLHVTHTRPHQTVGSLPMDMNGLGTFLELRLKFCELARELREIPLQSHHFPPEFRQVVHDDLIAFASDSLSTLNAIR